MCWYSDTRYATLHSCHSATIHPVLCLVCPVLCPVVPVFDEFALAAFLFIQVLTERHNPPFSIVILVVVGSNPISHPIHSKEDFVVLVLLLPPMPDYRGMCDH